jgi:hypothetical protein
LRLTLWNVPTTPRLKIDQKPSIVFVSPSNCYVREPLKIAFALQRYRKRGAGA